MIAIVDYQVGNIGNVSRAFRHLEEEVVLMEHPRMLHGGISLVVLPGVGAYGPASESLVRSGWGDSLKEWVHRGGALLGICLGMQLLCETGLENGSHRGLGLIPGTVQRLKARKLPHMGWNTLAWTGNPPSFSPSVPAGEFFYFVHSYALSDITHACAATTLDGEAFASMVLRGTVAGFQFHPERSGRAGLALLRDTLSFLRGKSAA